MFAREGIPVWDADAAVHELYGFGGRAVEPVRKISPGAIIDGVVSRDHLRQAIEKDAKVIDALNKVVHPLVADHRQAFLDEFPNQIVLLDIPLLFETKNETLCDVIVVVSAPADVQRARVLARETMSEDAFETILARQMPDAEKRARADYVIETITLDGAKEAVKDVLKHLRQRQANA